MTHDEILDALNFRHACKEFDSSKKINKDDMYIVLEAGRLAPSSLGIEPWKFLVIKNEALKNKLGEVSWGGKKQIPTCSHLVIALSRMPNDLRYNSDYINYILKDVNNMPDEYAEKYKSLMKSFEESAFKDNDKSFLEYSMKQTYLAAANMMTIAAFQKIDSCPIGGFDQDAVENILIENNLLDKNHFHVTLMIAFGYRVNEPEKKERQSFREVVEIVD